jgi:hypothetical protein
VEEIDVEVAEVWNVRDRETEGAQVELFAGVSASEITGLSLSGDSMSVSWMFPESEIASSFGVL